MNLTRSILIPIIKKRISLSHWNPNIITSVLTAVCISCILYLHLVVHPKHMFLKHKTSWQIYQSDMPLGSITNSVWSKRPSSQSVFSGSPSWKWLQYRDICTFLKNIMSYICLYVLMSLLHNLAEYFMSTTSTTSFPLDS